MISLMYCRDTLEQQVRPAGAIRLQQQQQQQG
jgi:hypothetical protein